MIDWKVVKFENIARIISGGTPKTNVKDYWNGEIPWITPKDLSGYNSRYISKGARNISKFGLKNSSAKLSPKGSVLLSSRAPIGYVAISEANLSTNQGMKSLIPKSNTTTNFLYYLTVYNVPKLIHIASGSTFKEISTNEIRKFDVMLPNVNEQKAIANILSSLDDKIELNNKINKNLEELAQTLYKRWFVEFEFPNDDGLPYKSSGGNMVESELGLIPDGWKIIDISSIIIQERIKTNPNDKERLIDLANMPQFSISLDQYGNGDKLTTNLFKMFEGNFLYGSIRPYLGKFGIAPFDGITTGTIHQYKPLNERDYSLLATITFSKQFNDFCDKLSHGTKMPTIKWDDFITYKFPYSSQLSKQFNELMKEMYLKIINNVNENINLRGIRDLLLPKLMSGEIRVLVEG